LISSVYLFIYFIGFCFFIVFSFFIVVFPAAADAGGADRLYLFIYFIGFSYFSFFSFLLLGTRMPKSPGFVYCLLWPPMGPP